MAEHPLHDLHVRARADGEAGGGVPQLVWGQPVETDLGCRLVEPAAAEDAPAEPGVASSAGEDGSLCRSVAGEQGELTEDGRGDGNRPGLVVLRRGLDLPPTDLDDRMPHLEPPAAEVDVADTETGQLAPAEPAVGEHADQGAVAVCRAVLLTATNGVDRVRESPHLLVRQVPLAAARHLRQLQAAGRVRHEPAVSDGGLERAREHVDALAHARRSLRLREPGSPALHGAVGELRQWVTAERGPDESLHDADDALAGRRAEVGALLEPRAEPVVEQHAAARRVHVHAAALVDLDRRQEQLGVALRAETPLRGLPIVRSAVKHPVAAPRLRWIALDRTHSAPLR
ncbi:hypothetical protein QDR37_14250 [Amnibacterium sp. CER49]|uniref:FAD/NAD(P)-binding protein n=1 Tax=Amnibacterium sp. CER49 TaxID=3039161 RepID=UPI00244C409F|nr:FAD/NAD(P)-binding protein [Amnibacterium sp. CER49]MDH2445111.1 hypothetical protein [Amnibacterium sp. CER49]